MSPAIFHLAILRSAAFLVPQWQRTDWLAEWRSELWHIRRDPGGRSVAAFCLGAFRDATWLRRNRPISAPGILHLDHPGPPAGIADFPDAAVPALSSPLQCLSWLAALVALCAMLAFLLPPARSVLLRYPDNLVMLTDADKGDPYTPNGFMGPYPSVSREQFDALKANGDGQFTALAFYATARQRMETPSGIQILTVARSTPELFRILNIPLKNAESGVPTLVLTRWTWRTFFNSDPRITTVVSDRAWNLPVDVDAWLIGDDAALALLPASAEGFVLAQLRHENLANSRFRFIRLRARSLMLLSSSVPIFLLAFLAAAIASFSSRRRHLGPWGVRRAFFLTAKILLVLPIVMLGSLDLGSLTGALSVLFFDFALFGSAFAARWILADQRRRCPVCLRLLANPVRIGETSHVFLEWHGTELVCPNGHGLLYIPEWPAIWSGRQRRMDLGPSWSGLFVK